jgi:flagellar basal-body rod protein FlgG
MIRALYTAASGMNAQQTNIDNTAHNLSNVNTVGFKKARVEFEDLVYQTTKVPGTPNSSATEVPIGLEMGLGTRAVATARDFATGNLRTTSGPLDLAIEGNGFFQVTLPDGRTAYTRAGAFHLNAEGLVVTAEGYSLEPQISIPSDATSISISKEGVVSVAIAGQQAPHPGARRQLLRRDNGVGRADDGRAGDGVDGHGGPGLPRRIQRQHRRGNDQHDPRSACLRSEFPRRAHGG